MFGLRAYSIDVRIWKSYLAKAMLYVVYSINSTCVLLQVSASVSVPNLSSSQEASQMMEGFTRSMTRAPAVLDVNNLSSSEENSLARDAPDAVGKSWAGAVRAEPLLLKQGCKIFCEF